MNKSALASAPSSTNQAVAEGAETVIFLAQFEYLDARGTFWPAHAYTLKKDAVEYVNKVNCTHPDRFYTVQAISVYGEFA